MSAVELDRVSLWRRTQEEYPFDLKWRIFALLQRRYRKPSRRCVLDNVSLRVEPGEKLGIIGPNGAGKTTLLKIICGILEPSSGCVETRGAIAPLIELGAGFDLDLPVRDNIVLYGVLLGRSHEEMEAKIPEILRFAELEEYASAPVRVLSSGMSARLGFAIATDANPDILILDEVLAVGDESFRKKSRRRIESLWREHVAVLVVSHELPFIRESCTNALWMDGGRIRASGPADYVVKEYQASVDGSALSVLERAKATLR